MYDAAATGRPTRRLPRALHRGADGAARSHRSVGAWRGLRSCAARPGAPRDQAFIVHRTHADPRCVDLSLDPNDRAAGQRVGRCASGQLCGQRDGALHLADRVPVAVVVAVAVPTGRRNLARTSVPALLLTYTADQWTFPCTRDAWLKPRAARASATSTSWAATTTWPGSRQLVPEAADAIAELRPHALVAAKTAMETFRFAPAYELPSWPFEPPPELAPRRVRRHPIVIAGAGLAGLTLACDLAQRGVAPWCSTRTTPSACAAPRRAASAMRRRASRSSSASASSSGSSAKGVTWSLGRTFSGDERGLQLRAAVQTASRASRRSSTCSSSTSSGSWSTASCELGHHRTALEEPGDARRAARPTACASTSRHARRRLHDRGRLADRRHRRQQPDPHAARARCAASHSTDRWCITDVRFNKPLPIERWTWVDAPLQRRPRGLAAPDGRRRLAHGLPDGLRRRPEEISRPEVAGRGCAPARPGRGVRVRLDRPVSDTATSCSTVPPRPGVLHRRCRARGQPVRRPRRQHRHPGRGQPRLEARAGAARPGAGERCSTATTPSAARGRAEPRGDEPHRALPRAAIAGRAHAAPRRLALAAAIRSRGRWSTPGACRWPTTIRLRRVCPKAAAPCRTCRCAGPMGARPR